MPRARSRVSSRRRSPQKHVDRDRLAAELAEIDALPVIALHPNVAADYRCNIEKLGTALNGGDAARIEAIPAVRNLIEAIVLTPEPDGTGFQIELEGRLANLLNLAMGKKMAAEPAGMFLMVAEEAAIFHNYPTEIKRFFVT